MRTTHLRSRGKSLLKRATKLNPSFARSSGAHLVTLTMILLRTRDNAHSKPVVPVNRAKMGLAPPIDDQDVVQIQTETLIPDKVMTTMDDPGTVRAHLATLTKILRNIIGNDLDRIVTFVNVLTRMTSLMKDIINSIECPDDHVRKPKPA
jgi:hypothetical protein